MINTSDKYRFVSNARGKCVHFISKEEPLWSIPLVRRLWSTLRSFEPGKTTHLRFCTLQSSSVDFNQKFGFDFLCLLLRKWEIKVADQNIREENLTCFRV